MRAGYGAENEKAFHIGSVLDPAHLSERRGGAGGAADSYDAGMAVASPLSKTRTRAVVRQDEDGGRMVPRIDLYEQEGEFVIEVDLPGVSATDVEVNVGRDRVVIRGRRGHEEGRMRAGAAALHRQERHGGFFEREIPLPHPVLRDAAQATLRAGVLCVKLVIAKPPPALQCLSVRTDERAGRRRLQLAKG